MAQLKLLQGYEGNLITAQNPVNETETPINPTFSEGQLLFTIQDIRLNDEITSINADYGGYIYLDYLFNSNKYRLPMISPYSDKALYDFTSGIALSNSVKDDSITMDTINHTTLLWQNFDGDNYAVACNYYPTNFTWNANTGAVNLSYYLQKGASNNAAIYDTITLDSIPIATETTAGILTGEVAADEQRSNIQFIGGIKKFTNLVQLTKGDNYPIVTDTNYTATLTVEGGTHITQDVRIDGTHLLLNRTAKIECDAEKSAINFVFL